MLKSFLATAALVALPLMSAAAQNTAPKNVLSIQPFSAMLTVYAGEYERRVGNSMTLGVGGTYWNAGDEGDDVTYTSGDVKLRFYPQGIPLRGFSLGVSGGYTSVKETIVSTESSEGGATFGTFLEYQWLMGAKSNFALTFGAGAKMLFVDEEQFNDITLRYPTARISIGYGF